MPSRRAGPRCASSAILVDHKKPKPQCNGITVTVLRAGVNGGNGNDLVLGTAGVNSPLRGMAGNDCIHGGGGADLLRGDNGTDVCIGGPGTDTFHTTCETQHPVAPYDRAMARSELTIDLGAIRRNVATLLRALDGAELWAVVKADGYGHGAADVGRAALEAGATALCVATVPEGAGLRRALPEPRILVLGPSEEHELAEARAARLELTVADGPLPTGIPVHLKLDTGMGRWGMSELPAPGRDVVGVMSHLASADCDAEFTAIANRAFCSGFTGSDPVSDAPPREQRRRASLPRRSLRRGALRDRDLRPLAVRHRPGRRRPRARAPLGVPPGAGQAPARRATPPVTAAASSPSADTWIGIVPVGYADGFRRDLSGTEVVVDGEPRQASSGRSPWMRSRSSSSGSSPSGRR